MRELTGPRRLAVNAVLSLRRRWYSWRFPTLELGENVMFAGRIRVRSGTRVVLGDNVRIRKLVRINGGGTVVIGSNTLLNGCWIIAHERVTLGSHCLVSDCGIMDTDFHNLPPRLRHEPPNERSRAPVEVGTNVWLGTGSLVLKGASIGDGSAVGAGSVVRGRIESRVVVSGNPAAVVKRFDDDA